MYFVPVPTQKNFLEQQEYNDIHVLVYTSNRPLFPIIRPQNRKEKPFRSCLIFLEKGRKCDSPIFGVGSL